MPRPALSAVILLLAMGLPAQSNAVPGTDVNVYDIVGASVFGRLGPAHPNGEAGISIGHSFCNAGTVAFPWIGTGANGVLLETCPKIAFLLAREADGRMVQISGESFCKYSRVAFNAGFGPCLPCQPGPINTMRVGCGDTYGAGLNGNRSWLGPTTEINPWLGTWNPVGSYFDVGDPPVSGAAATDAIQSLSSTQIAAMDVVKNRMTVRETWLASPGTFYGQVQMSIAGEPVGNRGNNLVSRAMTFTWNAATQQWATSMVGANLQGSVLTRWSGASHAAAGNGLDDGRFLVAVKVTGPTDGMWHYEYAVHNLDNDRGGASLRLPMCPTARVANVGFKDVDEDPLNEWTATRSASELAFTAAANNALDWNCIYNFWFDCDAAPVAGTVAIDQARIGPGGLTVAVGSSVPTLLMTEYVGAGCGTPEPVAFANALPVAPNPTFAVQFRVQPSAFIVVGFSFGVQALDLGSGCTLFLQDPVVRVELTQADATGLATCPVPITAGTAPIDWYCQGFEVVADGPWLGLLAATNGLRVRVDGSGCP